MMVKIVINRVGNERYATNTINFIINPIRGLSADWSLLSESMFFVRPPKRETPMLISQQPVTNASSGKLARGLLRFMVAYSNRIAPAIRHMVASKLISEALVFVWSDAVDGSGSLRMKGWALNMKKMTTAAATAIIEPIISSRLLAKRRESVGAS